MVRLEVGCRIIRLYISSKTIDEKSELVGREPGKNLHREQERAWRALISFSMSCRAFFEFTFTIMMHQAEPCHESDTREDKNSQVKANF
jgi:hypothetical protein